MHLLNDKHFVYVGTYSSGNEGIFVYTLDVATGVLQLVEAVGGDVNPSYLVVHPNRRYLYAVNETQTYNGQKGGAVSAYAIQPGTGRLTRLNRQPTLSEGPCHVSIDATGRFALVSNYGGGALTVLPILEDGRLGYPTDLAQHQAIEVSGTLKPPHVHSALPDPTGRHILVADLALDRLVTYTLDPQEGKLSLHSKPWVECLPSSGPRHFTFHTNSGSTCGLDEMRLNVIRLYVINELNSTISTFTYDTRSGTCKELQTVSALPPDFTDESWCADIHVHPNGKYLYGSNRGHDSLVAFAIDETTGLLTYISHVPTAGKWPRNFAIDPTGALLLVANERSDSIVTYWVDQETGQLCPTECVTTVSKPACIMVTSST